MPVSSREDFAQYCLRRLGAPVIQINVSEDQVQDRIDDAIQFFSKYHYDGVMRMFMKHVITQEDFDRRYIISPTSIASVVQVFPLTETGGTGSLFDIQYQMALSDLYYFGSIDTVGYSVTKSHVEMMRQLFNPQKAIRFSRIQNKIFIDTDWTDHLRVGSTIVIEAYRILDPVEAPEIWDDELLKRYATALIKRQWGANLSKYNGLTLPGGVTLDGKTLYTEADSDIQKIEDRIISMYELPIDIVMG